MAEPIEFVRTLAAEIGPRPATTDAERRAAQWIRGVFESHGLETTVHEFAAPRTYAWSYVLYHLATLTSAVAAGLRPSLVWLAFAVSALAAILMWMDLDTRWGLTSLMPKGTSQNVIARLKPAATGGKPRRRVVVVAHYDSARASLAFAPNMVDGLPTTFGLMKACTFVVPVLVLAMAIPFTDGLEPWLWYATMAASAYLVIPLVINVHRELFMPFVAGANDNASGVGAMLGAMQLLVGTGEGGAQQAGFAEDSGPAGSEHADAGQGLGDREVWFVATGAEEVGTCGMQSLLRDYRDELRDAVIINLDGAGDGQLHWVTAEGMARRYYASDSLTTLARGVAQQTGTEISPTVFRGLSTDASPALARGYDAMSIMALTSAGVPAHWHWVSDTVDSIDPDMLRTVARFTAAMVRQA